MRLIATLLLCLAVPTYVEAKPVQVPVTAFAGDRYVAQPRKSPLVSQKHRAATRHYRAKRNAPRVKYRAPRPYLARPLTLAGGFTREIGRAVILGGRPVGCPARFCGCGASIHLFGRIIPRLNLAANWLAFPRTAPAPNMVAARRGHVFVLKQHIAGSTWLVHDSNSGGRRTRIHPRSIAGYAIVNPHGRNVASL